MSKSTHTPDSATPDQALESGSDLPVTPPTGPIRIFTALDRKSFLQFKSIDEPLISIIDTNTTLFPLWVFKPSSLEGAYHIHSFTASGIFINGDLESGDVFAGTSEESWKIWDAGEGLVYIQKVGSDEYLNVWGGALGAKRVVLTVKSTVKSLKFMLGANPT